MKTLPAVARHGIALAAGAGAAAGVAALHAAEVVPGRVAVALAIVIVLAVPSSRLLARRILWHGAILVGVVPMLWWADLPLGSVGRSGLLLAVGVGGLTAWLAWDGVGGLAGRARRVVPAWQAVDLLPVGAALVSAWFLKGWLRAATGAEALAALVPGWDHSAHFGMVRSLRLMGATSDVVPPPAGETWAYASYPQGYHTVVATLMELVRGTSSTDLSAELVTYLRATSLMLVGAAVLLTAGLSQLPRLRRRPAVAAPLAALAVGGFVIGPGATSFTHGFVNFVVVAALTACVPLVVVTMARVPLPVPLAALGGLLVAVAHGWVLMLVMALPMAAVVIVPLRRARWRAGRRAWWASGVVLVVTVLGLLAALRILLVHDVDSVLLMPGAVETPELGPLVLVISAAVGLTLWGSARRSPRSTWSAVGPVMGLIAVGSLAALQLDANGGLSYYFWKLLTAIELVSVVLVGVAVARWPSRPRPGRPLLERLRIGFAALLVTVGATQAFEAGVNGDDVFPVPDFKVAPAQATLRAAEVAASAGGPTVVIFPVTEHSLHPLNAQQWHLALGGTWTTEANIRAGEVLLADLSTPDGVLLAARQVLSDPRMQVIVPPEAAQALLAALPDDLAARVRSW